MSYSVWFTAAYLHTLFYKLLHTNERQSCKANLMQANESFILLFYLS